MLLLTALMSLPHLARAGEPAATASGSATCGNGHLDAGETCDNCSADCAVHTCTPAGKPRRFEAVFQPPSEMKVSSITVRVGYDSRRVSLPGSAGAESARARLQDTPKTAIIVTNDLDYAVRAVVTQPGGIAAGKLFTLSVDACKGAPAPTVSDFGCALEGCAAASNPIDGCSCRVQGD